MNATIRKRTRSHYVRPDRIAFDCNVQLTPEVAITAITQAAALASAEVDAWIDARALSSRVVDRRDPVVRMTGFALYLTVEFSVLNTCRHCGDTVEYLPRIRAWVTVGNGSVDAADCRYRAVGHQPLTLKIES